MVSVSLFDVVNQIRCATSWLSLGCTEREGTAIRVVAMAKRLKIVLSDGSSVLWNMSQARVDAIVSMYTYNVSSVWAQ